MPALPSTNLTLHVDASDADHIWKLFQAGSPFHSGVPADGDQVAVWEDDDGQDLAWLTDGATSATTDPTWRTTTPLMKHACLDFDASQVDRYRLWNLAGTSLKTLADGISASAFVCLVAFRLEGTPSSNTNVWDNTGITSDTGAFWGIHLKDISGTPNIFGFNWDGNDDHISIAIALNTDYVVVFYHTGGNISLEVYSNLGQVGTTQTTTSGNTSTLTNSLRLANDSGGLRFLDGRIGEFVLYNAYNATDKSNATQYFKDKWLTIAGGARSYGYIFG